MIQHSRKHLKHVKENDTDTNLELTETLDSSLTFLK